MLSFSKLIGPGMRVGMLYGPPDLLAKARSFGKDLAEFSLDTVKMFYQDAVKSGFSL